MTPSGIEPATFQLVAQCLNQLRYGVPQRILKYCMKTKIVKFRNLKLMRKAIGRALNQIKEELKVSKVELKKKNQPT